MSWTIRHCGIHVIDTIINMKLINNYTVQKMTKINGVSTMNINNVNGS
jgi:hypothetical protein